MGTQDGIRCMWMRGGTSKGAYFLEEDLPSDTCARDAVLLRIMGSPDPRQIDGIGGGDPLSSKVAVVRKSTRAGVDVDYLFLQVFPDQALVSDAQNCGNILAGVAPFAIERGLVVPSGDATDVTVYMENTGQTARAKVVTRGGRVCYDGDAQIDGVPGTAAPVRIAVEGTEGSMCGALFPSGHVVDRIAGLDVTLIDNGMPVIVVSASDLGLTGAESPDALEADDGLRARLEDLRRQAGPVMGLGDVSAKSVPKISIVSSARAGGVIATRTFIPYRCHKAIGVFGAVSVATACLMEGAVGHALAGPAGDTLLIEHPTGALPLGVAARADGGMQVQMIRTARKLMDGTVFAG